jgi:hypothetical protein
MRTIALEEHFATPEFLRVTAYAEKTAASPEHGRAACARLADLGEARIADMDAAGIDMQVLSLVNGGMDSLDADIAAGLARDANDQLAAAVRARPDRFAGFAALAMQQPEKAAAEFERAVRQLGFKGAMIHGTVNGVFLDDPRFTPVFEAAQALDVPIYLHPTAPPPAVQQAYYGGLPGRFDFFLSRAAWGWHAELGMHCLRLIVSGLFDRFPRLKIMIGHLGENLPFSLARADSIFSRRAKLPRGVAEYFHEHFYVTTSGYFTLPPFLCALQVVGADSILFSVDYPFSSNAEGRAFLNSLAISPQDLEKISHLNAERLLRL